VVTIPFRNPQAQGASQYVFYPTCIEICRTIKAVGGSLTMEYAAEGAQIAQRTGSYAAQQGMGARPTRGRLEITDQYRDLYFGAPGLGPEWADKGGWFDFCWEKEAAGLGVVLARQWRTRASKAGYDVTRYYDAHDWIEVVQIWQHPTAIQQETSRIFLIPHGPAELLNPNAWSPAQALWERIRHPARLLRPA
jgi:hypothetical protein